MKTLDFAAEAAQSNNTAAAPVDRWVRSVCRFCGSGCGLYAGVFGAGVVSVAGDKENWNKGSLCIKGESLPFILSLPTRMQYPLFRRNDTFHRISWEEAMEIMAERFADSIKQHGANSVAFYGSGQSYTEESYVINKLFKGGLGTNTIDGNPRLCMSSAAAGYITSFGKDEPMGTYDDINHADCFFIIGSNMAECHPVLYGMIAERKAGNSSDIKVIVADPRRTATTSIADLHLSLIPGSDALILNAMANVIVKERLYNQAFITRHTVFKRLASDGRVETTGWDDYVRFLDEYTPETAAKGSGCLKEDIIKAARWFAESKAAMSLWTMGLNQRTSGTGLNNLVHNLHLLTGHIARPGATPFSLSGQPNACGGVRDAGLLSHLLPFGRSMTKEEDRRDMERFWNVPAGRIDPKPGPAALDIFRMFTGGAIKCLWVVCTNPWQSLPSLSSYKKGKGTFLVVSEAFHPTKTSEIADLVLPSALWVEKDGTFGNSDRRYQYLERAVEPIGEARPDMDVMIEFSRKLLHLIGQGDEAERLFSYKNSQEVWDEIRECSKGTVYDFSGMTRERLKQSGIQWPCPSEDHPGAPRRYTAWFAAKYGDPMVGDFDPHAMNTYFYGANNDDRRGRASIWLRPWAPPYEQPDKEYPFVLTTGRVLEHWHTGAMTLGIHELRRRAPAAYIEINPKDAARLGIRSGNRVKVSSRRGSLVIEAKVADVPRDGVVFVPMHYPDKLINTLTTDACDPISKEPEFKICAVKIEKTFS
ncbi:MAG: molybdopterin-dependent oxidoreductase [Deltaproteobacteria bacterium]|nr:molybdopterin-dependent oxidoreductase [Deltaproteobacteria bacterium]